MNKLLKRFISIGLVMVLSVSVSACTANKNEPKTPINIAVLKGPTGMGMAKLMEDESDLVDPNFLFSAYGSPDELVSKIINNEVDIAALPTNLASVIYNKTGGDVELIAVNTLGVIYILDTTGTINSIKDLKGKNISASGKGTVVEYVFSYLLKSNGLDPEKDLEIDYSFSHEELSAHVAAGNIEIALLPQPFVTTTIMKNKNVEIAVDLTEEWDALENGSQLTMGCLVASKAFVEANKDKLDDFLNAYEESVTWVNDNPERAGEYIEKHGIIGNKEVATIAIPNCSIVYKDGKEAKEMLQGFYKVLFEIDAKALGGTLPNDAFYYQK
ncbi:MAG: hypothetical protein CVV02_05305 [Firmicutes bacterium HGW-Firmicutes-7]|nr:MAG: hypothetical protein CVV02_05305 [Firmicutes bacterium HGW-Firmicutes-7]